jgi:pre-mRNA 3'-end-processing factor FIP1
MEEDDDDLYDPADTLPSVEPPKDVDNGMDGEVKMDLEDGEEEEEEEEEDEVRLTLLHVYLGQCN